MYKIEQETLDKVHRPFDFVESKIGSFGYIQEVNINESQENFNNQVSYSVNWIVSKANEKNSWWHHSDLQVKGNMFKELAKCAVHPFGNNKKLIDLLM